MNNQDFSDIIFTAIEEYIAHTPVPSPTDALRVSHKTKEVDIVIGADLDDFDHEMFDYYCLLGLLEYGLGFEGPDVRGDKIWKISALAVDAL